MKIPLSDSVLDEVHGLALACLSGEASQTDVDRLGALLLESEAARRVYVDAIRDSFGLRRWAAAEKLHAGDMFDAGGSDAEFLRLAVSDAEPADLADLIAVTSSSGVSRDERRDFGSGTVAPRLGFLATQCRNAAGYLSGHEFLMSYLVATVVFAIVTLVSCYLPAPYQSAVRREADGLVRAESAPASKTLIPRQETVLVGRITGAADCRWADPKLAPDGAAVPMGGKYALASGLVEITYDTGARVILQGPCTYEVDSARSGFLSLGKLTARVETPSAISGQLSAVPSPKSPNLQTSKFIVRTPSATVTDLGTAFGVEVTREGRTEARVFQGVVRVTSAASGAGSAPHERVCREGEGAHVDAGDAAVHAIDPRSDMTAGFVRAMPPPQSVRESQAYADFVLSLKPAVYYRMERPPEKGPEKGTGPIGAKHPSGRPGQLELSPFPAILDSAPGGHHGVFRAGEGSDSPFVPGRFGDALWLRGPGFCDRVIVPDYPKAAGGRLTVAAWVLATARPEWAMIASNWGIPNGDRQNTGQFHLGLFQDRGDLSARVTQRDGQTTEVREGEPNPLPLDLWQHVALVADGTALRLYRNGKQVAAAPCAGVLPWPPVAGLGIGCRTNAAGDDAYLSEPELRGRSYGWYWQGRIDELAIFNDALSPQIIGQLYLGKPSQPQNAEMPAKRR